MPSTTVAKPSRLPAPSSVTGRITFARQTARGLARRHENPNISAMPSAVPHIAVVMRYLLSVKKACAGSRVAMPARSSPSGPVSGSRRVGKWGVAPLGCIRVECGVVAPPLLRAVDVGACVVVALLLPDRPVVLIDRAVSVGCHGSSGYQRRGRPARVLRIGIGTALPGHDERPGAASRYAGMQSRRVSCAGPGRGARAHRARAAAGRTRV
ncbi:hypothetical protein FBX98_12024 [Burkholderia sp. SJZ115]|nr:hypothetical protein FB600_120122 [Burkholderia sp. SJZ089]TWC95721.1 hypothetical protein FBX98_12024 [Burkholderia sp. SJZ115]TWC99028.1 hypothetical protein FB601_11923 [Burkholderia sp. SJZ091]